MIIPVIFEDKNIIVINKPSGVVVHPFDFSHEETVLDFLMMHCPDIFKIKNEIKLQDGRTINLGGIVHKLDRDTSGVMVIAKTKEFLDNLKNQFSNQTISKTYLAKVEGSVDKNSFIIDAPLGRNKKDYKQVVNPLNPRGELREAVTHVEVLERSENFTLVKLNPKTGRTHQLRAHMLYIGHPIIGDNAYGSNVNSKRILLHANLLKFKVDEKDFEFEAPIPNNF
jgi:23S rRNA pseudouridine1911/1915/1917 synthase